MIAGHAPADSPLPFTLAVDDAALSREAGGGAVHASAPKGSRLTARGARNSTTPTRPVRAQKIFSIAPAKPYVVNVSASVTVNGNPVATTLRWGPALGSGITLKSRTYNPPPQPIFFKDGKVSRIAPAQDRGRSPRWTACSVSPASTITTSWSRASSRAKPLHLAYSAVDVHARGSPRRRALRLVVGALSVAAAGRGLFRRPEGFRRARRGRPRAGPRDRLRHVLVPGRAAAARAEVAEHLRRQLRLVARSC